MNPADVDTLMSFIPEASFKMMSIGTPCIGNDGKTFCSLGSIKKDDTKKKSHNQTMLSNTSNNCLSPYMSALYYDSANPARQDVIQVLMNEALPLLDLDLAKTQVAARKSIFMDAQALEILMELMLT